MAANWISHREALGEPDAYFLARRRVELRRVPDSLVVAIAAGARYRLRVNGREVLAGPARGTRTIAFADVIDIGPHLVPGENWIAVAVHSPNRPTFTASAEVAALRIETRATPGSGEIAGLLDTDERWECHAAPEWRRRSGEYTFQIGWMEYRDLRRAVPGWDIGAPGAEWGPALIVPDERIPQGVRDRDIPLLAETRIPPQEVIHLADVRPVAELAPFAEADAAGNHPVARLLAAEEHLPPGHALEASPGAVLHIPAGSLDPVLLLRFPQEVNGGLALELEAPAGTVIDIVYDETLVDGRAAATVHGYSFVDRFVASGRREHIMPGLHVRGFRLVQLVIRRMSAPLTLHAASAVDRRYPLGAVGDFDASDPVLRQIWEACARTLSACAVDTFVDCPWRENALYLNDLLVENRVALQLSGDGRLAAHCLRMAASQIADDGLIPAAIPSGCEPGRDAASSARHMSFPSANLFLPLIALDHLLHTGDTNLAVELLPTIETVLAACERFLDDEGLIAPPPDIWNFVDWSFELNGVSLDGSPSASLSLLWVLSMQAAAQLERWVRGGEDPQAGVERGRRAAAAAQRIEDLLLDPRTGRYREWNAPDAPMTALAQSLALLVSPDGSTEQRRSALTDPALIAPELFLHHFLLEAMAPSPRALDVVRERWAPIVAAGPGTIWESGVYEPGRDSFDGAGSLCHGFATSPVGVLQRQVLGVRPLAPGFRRALIDPVPADLTWANGRVPTPFGPILIAWEASPSGLDLSVEVPDGVAAELASGEALPPGRHRLRLPIR